MLEAYSVAVRLRLIDSVSSGLMGMAAQFAAFNRHVNTSQANLKALEGQLQRIKLMGVLGGAAMGVGGFGLFALKAPLDEAAKWVQEATRTASLGLGAKVNQDAQQFALGMQTYGTSARDNLTLLNDALAQFKDLDSAKFFAPIMARMKFANEAVFGESGRANESKFQDMLQLIDIRGGVRSPAQAKQQANFLQQVISGSRGRVDAMQMLQAARTGGVAISQMSDSAFYLGLEPIVREFGGQRTGTGLMSVYQNLVQSRGTITAQQELFRLGLLDPKRVQFNNMGMLKKALPGAFRGSDILETEGPLALLTKVLLPAFASKGLTSDSDVIRELGMILGNRTGSSLMSRIYQQRQTIAMQSAANAGADNIDTLYGRALGTPQGKQIQLHAQYMNLLRELGIAALPIFTKAVAGLSSVLKAGVSFARAWPTLTKGLVVAFVSLSALMVAGGAVTLIAAGFKALGLAMVVGRGIGLGASLLSVAGGLGSVAAIAAKFMGIAGLAAGAAGAGYLVGDAINKTGPNGDLGGWLGGKLYEFLNPYNPNAKSTTVHTSVHIDGQKVAAVISKHQAKAATSPQTGVTGYDSRSQMIPAGGF